MPSIVSSGATVLNDNSGNNGSSAPVLEYVCLFTHDLRRKQKRWQDGRLKYHTFNKRVMVHDERGNFVGDMHWQRDWEFDEGEEVELERGGVIVQVAECIGRQNQDLTELLGKRAKEKEERQTRTLARTAPSPGSTLAHTPGPINRIYPTRSDNPPPIRQRHLHQVIGTPTGHHGRALVPTESPFEQRQQENETRNDRAEPPPSKRRKYDDPPSSKMGYAQSLFGASLTLSAVPMSSAPIRRPGAAVNRNYSQPASSLEEVVQPDEPVVQTGEVYAHPGMRAGLSRTTNPAPLLKPQPKPSDQGAEKARKVTDHARQPASRSRAAKDEVGHESSMTVSRSSSRVITIPSDRPQFEPTVRESSRTETGRSHSEALFVGDDSEDGAAPTGLSVQPRMDSANRSGSKAVLSRSTRKKAPKGSNAPSISAEMSLEKQPTKRASTGRRDVPHDEDSQPLEQRTELRIKPRQKRGLMMLSEKPSKMKRSKIQHDDPHQSTAAIEVPMRAVDTVIGEPIALHTKTTNYHSSPEQDDDAFATSRSARGKPSTSRKLHRAPHNDASDSDGHTEEVDKSTPVHSAVKITESNRRERPQHSSTVGSTAAGKQEEPLQNTDHGDGDAEDILPPIPPSERVGQLHNMVSPVDEPRRRTRQRKKTRGLGESNSYSGEDDIMVALENASTRSSENRHPAHQERKQPAGIADGSDSEELPQVPVRPRLARLSRKSVRSREVFGFVPSSSPPIATLGQVEPLPPFLCDVNSTITAGAPEEPSDMVGQSPRVVDVTQHWGSKNSTPGPPTVPYEEVSAALQRRNSLGDTTDQEIPVHGSRQGTTVTESFNRTPSRCDEVLQLSPGESASGSGRATDPSPSTAATRPQDIAAEGKNSAEKVIGLVAEEREEHMHSTEASDLASGLHKASNFAQQHKRPINVPQSVGAFSLATSNDPMDHTPSAGNQRPRLANPATRGRKAALKSHAAGQVPQSILPLDPAPVRLATRPEIIRPEAAANERPKRRMRLPGFTTARDAGPWSREAHDLLETGRPSST